MREAAQQLYYTSSQPIKSLIADGKLKAVKQGPSKTSAWLVYAADIEQIKKERGITV